MSDEKILSKAISKSLKGSYIKWLAIGFGIAVVTGGIVGIGVYFGIQDPTTPNPEVDPFSTQLAESVYALISNVVHVEIIGNASAQINDRLISATFDRIGDNVTYAWNVTAYAIFPSEVINFVLNTNQVNQIGQGLLESINNTERVGTYGVEPYPAVGETPNMKWVTELYLENSTVIYLYIDMENLILFQTETWSGDYIAEQNMLGAAVLEPESAFDNYVSVLSALFAPYF